MRRPPGSCDSTRPGRSVTLPACTVREWDMTRIVLGLAAVLMASACAAAPAASAQSTAQSTGEPAFRAMFKEMVETDTSFATGDCSALVTKIVARMKASGFPASQLYTFIPEGAPRAGNLVAVLPGTDPKALSQRQRRPTPEVARRPGWRTPTGFRSSGRTRSSRSENPWDWPRRPGRFGEFRGRNGPDHNGPLYGGRRVLFSCGGKPLSKQ